MTNRKIKVIKKGANVENSQESDKKAIKNTEIASKVLNWIEDFYRKKSEDEKSLIVFAERSG